MGYVDSGMNCSAEPSFQLMIATQWLEVDPLSSSVKLPRFRLADSPSVAVSLTGKVTTGAEVSKVPGWNPGVPGEA